MTAGVAPPSAGPTFKPGDLVRARGREWVVLPEQGADVLKLRPLGGAEEDFTLIYLPLEPERPRPARFEPPDPEKPGSREASILLRDALRLKLRAGAGPFRSFGNLNFEPRAYQLVPLLMALKLDTIRLLIADDVGIGKTIEAGLIAREMLDRGEVERLTVICPPQLCDQWRQELDDKFGIDAEVVRTGTARRLERGLRPDESVFDAYPATIVSLDYIKSDRRRHEFRHACPELVIVDEAHTCVRSNTSSRHQRYELVKGLVETRPARHMVLLTATPHSGDDVAFHCLLGLLHKKFMELAEMSESAARKARRAELALQFVQRRRGDIKEWRDSSRFPTRERREDTYTLTGAWGSLFAKVLDYARGMVKRAEGGTKLQQRMSWWAALALLRCISSSPAAASVALRTRLRATQLDNEEEGIKQLDHEAAETVLDGASEDALSLSESVPAGTLESEEAVHALQALIGQADALRGQRQDPKLRALAAAVRSLVRDGFNPVVFCRYIATATYVGEELARALPKNRREVLVITGQLTPEQRKERVDALGELGDRVTPVLVATDCLSEGINLQNHFDAVIHYDLAWNPTRHEQREGRVDRFGQGSRIVRSLMLYGKNNPVDGAVLKVILRKAERIRRELGIAVPLPADDTKVIETIMKTVLLGADTQSRDWLQLGLDLDLDAAEAEVDREWNVAKLKESRTVFAQRRMRPSEVLPEWRKAMSVLGGPEDALRFVRLAAERLEAPLDARGGLYRLPVSHLPARLQDRLEAAGVRSTTRFSFELPVPSGATHIHRCHSLVSILADYITEQALDDGQSELGARSAAIFTKGVSIRTFLFILRLRHQLRVSYRGRKPDHSMLAEECVAVALRGGGSPELMENDETFSMLSLEPARNMAIGQKTMLVRQAIAAAEQWQTEFDRFATQRAEALLGDHRRIRDASRTMGQRFEVRPALPVDQIGVYVFVPAATF